MEQARRYLKGLHAAVADDRTRKLRARSIEFVEPGWFRMRYVRHLIYFRWDGEALRIMRVLHDSMDETLHIP